MSETICAISTALGEGAIGIVRLSGDEAFRKRAILMCTQNSGHIYI